VLLLEKRVNELERQAKRQPLKPSQQVVKQPILKRPVPCLVAEILVPKIVPHTDFVSQIPPQNQVKQSPYLRGGFAQSLQNSRSMMLKKEMPIEIEGRWLMTLPGGFQYEIKFELSEKGTFGMTPTSLNSSGQYLLKQGVLSIVEPSDKRLLGFQWTAVNPNVLILTSQPKTEQTGANYLGATLTKFQ
jgi:hypothetical protein